jgi:large subunit ribosomal protein L15
MQLHQIKPNLALKKKKRIGRGGKRGTYSGRGMKGQCSRAGARIRPALRDLIKKLPKKRGTGKKAISSRIAFQVVNLGILEKHFKAGELVTLKKLKSKDLVKPGFQVKILGKGEITKKLTVKGLRLSKGAAEKVEKAGGI